jgi:hypothetical protein
VPSSVSSLKRNPAILTPSLRLGPDGRSEHIASAGADFAQPAAWLVVEHSLHGPEPTLPKRMHALSTIDRVEAR